MQNLKQRSWEIKATLPDVPLTSLLKNMALHFQGYSEAPAHAKLTEVSGYLPYPSPLLWEQKLRFNMVCQVVLLNVTVFHISFK